MSSVAKAIEQSLQGRVATYSFDYSKFADNWAGDDVIANCLAAYIDAVSQQYIKLGSDGKVILVGHSMGGLAIRYASNKSIRGRQVGASIAGVVTLDTPHRGSRWGGTRYARLAVAGATALPGDQFSLPNEDKDAARCLAPHRGGSTFPRGCGSAPPYLSKSTRLLQVVGRVTIKRTFIGLPVYSISLGGDSIVDSLSEMGYPGSGPGPFGADGTKLAHSMVDCTVTSGDMLTYLRKYGNAKLIFDVSTTLVDNSAMEALIADQPSAKLAGLVLTANLRASCSHIGITRSASALRATVAAIKTWIDLLDRAREQWIDYFTPGARRNSCLFSGTFNSFGVTTDVRLTQTVLKKRIVRGDLNVSTLETTKTALKDAGPTDAPIYDRQFRTYTLTKSGQLAVRELQGIRGDFFFRQENLILYPPLAKISQRAVDTKMAVSAEPTTAEAKELVSTVVRPGEHSLKYSYTIRTRATKNSRMVTPTGTYRDVLGVSLEFVKVRALNARADKQKEAQEGLDAAVTLFPRVTSWYAKGIGVVQVDVKSLLYNYSVRLKGCN